MSKDVKIEILYFKSGADVSLEFGLHGEYPMRLLTSVCHDMNAFFCGLKRAVSRSEIIIIVGGYDGKEYLPEFIAGAIGRGCSVPDYREFGVIAGTKYKLPDGAMPLAPSNRRFGGFLIESGPQTIISLTDDKKQRLDIINEFIVPYITEHYLMFSIKHAAAGKPNGEIEPVEAPDIASPAPAETQEASFPETPEDPIGETLEESFDEAENEAFRETVSDVPTKVADLSSSADVSGEIPTAPGPAPMTESAPVTVPASTIDFAPAALPLSAAERKETDGAKPDALLLTLPDEIEAETAKKPKNARLHNRFVRLACIILSLLILIGTAGSFLLFKKEKTPRITPNNYYKNLASLFHSYDDDTATAFEQMRLFHQNINAWITVGGTDIDYPVLSVEEPYDSSYYTGHLPDGSRYETGTIFSFSKISASMFSGAILMYGSAAEGGAFENLSGLYDSSPDGIITTVNKYNKTTWKIFSVFTESDCGNFDFESCAFTGAAGYREYLGRLSSASQKDTGVTYFGNEPVLLLIGICDGEKQVAAAILKETHFTYAATVPTGNDPSSDSNSNTASDAPLPQEENDSPDYEQSPGDDDVVLPSIPGLTQPSESSSHTSAATEPTPSKPEESKPSSSAPASSVTSSSQPASSGSETSRTTSFESTSSAPAPSEPDPPAPPADPLFTWDVPLKITSGGVVYSGSAVDLVARITEAEMGSGFPIEALKAQAVAAYCWLLNAGAASGKAPSAPIKVAGARVIEAVNAVKGTLIVYGDQVAYTYYYAYSAGHTANTQDIWGGAATPYLQNVDCQPDEELGNFETATTYSSEKIKDLIRQKCGVDVSNMPKSQWIVPTEYDENNLYCRTVSIGGKSYRGQYLRQTFFDYDIRSAAYTVSYNESNDTFTVTCKGWGHGVGMSQYGARSYANSGWTFEQILTHFYPGTHIVKY